MVHFGVPRGVDPKLLPAVGKFARYLTNAENQLAFAKLANVFPTTIGGRQRCLFPGAGRPAPRRRKKGMTAGAASMKPFAYAVRRRRRGLRRIAAAAW